ncbi:MAG TPA: bifunctional precorrin-2 dehydrogenase/sirohydrochlorin ferrochelatase [Bryobacteraceae bacterium]|nr:bifunctional precorrin-2 dehydrogenase/sirohydrochlorin ferrochelatase [Bryobacteraceae bacterium]
MSPSLNFRYPVFLKVERKRCLVVGEGPELPSKIATLVARGAEVVYVNPAAVESIANLAREGKLVWHKRYFDPADLDSCFLVLSDREDNAEIFKLAEARGVLCNAADDPEHCRFTFGSVLSRGPLTVGISTDGAAPALAVRLRQRLEREIGEEYAAFTEMLGELRSDIAASIPDFEIRRHLWYRLVDSDALLLIRNGDSHGAWRLLRAMVDEASTSPRGGQPAL